MEPQQPVFRKLRVFALDPGTAPQMGAAGVSEVVLSIAWEKLQPGPIGEYVKVIDENAAGRRLYDPVDLDDIAILAHDGLAPSDGNPKFHQQMVYAVAMQAIRTFEKALGRPIHWPQRATGYVKHIVIHPHYMPVMNAYYDPNKGKILFGYFEGNENAAVPGMIVFTCLSHDAIAHELSHPLLDAIPFSSGGEESDDVYALYEGLGDLLALLQRDSQPEFLRHQLALTRGDLAGPSQLGIVASQFGLGFGSQSGLRYAFGHYAEDGAWLPVKPDPRAFPATKQAHQRGELLLRAVFDALNRIYRSRVGDLLRIASEGTGVLPSGDLHPDLVNRLAYEAAKSATHVLGMCIRALDYCPKVGFTFGDYLRAIITADYDLVPTDPRKYRVAFAEAFRRFGIFPSGIGTMSIDTLLWPEVDPSSVMGKLVRKFILEMEADETGSPVRGDEPLHRREAEYALMERRRVQLQDYLAGDDKKMALLAGVDAARPFVYSIWPREHVGPQGESLSQWAIEIYQSSVRHEVSHTLLVDSATGLVSRALYRARGDAGAKLQRAIRDAGAQATAEQILARFSTARVRAPVERSLRVFAFDPSMAVQMETAPINRVTLRIPWEKLEQGPVGEYLEIVDYDPATGCFYDPIDVNHPYLIAEAGCAPSQDNPQFHQQMVYAVAMRTIRNFERALGRLALWSPYRPALGSAADGAAAGGAGVRQEQRPARERFVQRLRLYPHALREANAFYSPAKKAVLFGYFQSRIGSSATPVTVFTCLSHDIIAHELTHALLDGMHTRFAEASNPDVLAFHEAFADIVALFQHFSLPEVLENQIAWTRGDLASQNRLGELAQEFGQAIGNRGALRSAIGEYDETTGEWRPRPPEPDAYVTEMEPHLRGSLLVATVFDAFLTIYRSRVADLFRIATKGTGVLPPGRLHPDLVKRLAAEAAASAQSVLEMCIRALDYCPPVDITFGDYLRAVLTADLEFDPIDEHNHRTAFIEAFRRHGILPEGVRTFSLEGLLWQQTKAEPDEAQKVVMGVIRDWTREIKYWNLASNRRRLFGLMAHKRVALHRFLNDREIRKSLSFINPDLPLEVHALRPSTRVDLMGRSHVQWIIEITQGHPDFLDLTKAKAWDDQIAAARPDERLALAKIESDYRFRGGATLLVDAETGRVLYSITKPIDDRRRRENQRRYMAEVATRSLYATYVRGVHEMEPFAALHRF